MKKCGSSFSQPTERQKYWLDLYQAWQKSGLSMKAFADANGIKAQNLYFWKKELHRRRLVTGPSIGKPKFQKLQVQPATGCRIRLPNGTVIELEPPPDIEYLNQFLQHVAKLP